MKHLLPLLLALTFGAALGEEDRAQEALRFAESLFNEGDYYRAVTEYKRAAFLAPGTELEYQARFGIGKSYQAGKKWDQACGAFKLLADSPKTGPIGERARFELGETQRLSGDEEAAIETFRAFLKAAPKSADADRARLSLAACLARLARLQEAADVLGEIPETSPLAPEVKKAREALGSPPNLRPKSPGLAGGMSAVLPGSGQWYAGYPAGGAAYFLLNAAFIGGSVESFNSGRNTVGALLAVGALVVYAGNIYGAVGDANKANAEAEERYLKGIEGDLKLGSGRLARVGPGASEGGGLAMVWSLNF